jgi:hypothetical protein
MYQILLSITSAHFDNTMLGIPSGPGALNGFSLVSALLICALEMGLALHMGLGSIIAGAFLVAGLSRKNILARTLPLSSFELACCWPLSSTYVRSGILVLRQSPGGAVMYFCAVHKSGSIALSSQSCQWFFFVFSSSQPNFHLASLNCSQGGLPFAFWFLHAFLQHLSMSFLRTLSSLVHHCLACGPKVMLGTDFCYCFLNSYCESFAFSVQSFLGFNEVRYSPFIDLFLQFLSELRPVDVSEVVYHFPGGELYVKIEVGDYWEVVCV